MLYAIEPPQPPFPPPEPPLPPDPPFPRPNLPNFVRRWHNEWQDTGMTVTCLMPGPL
jgi:hypothetical protein